MPTIRYAVAQNNNHGTSEAAALFIGGAWLMAQAESEPLRKEAQRWRDAGRRWLEDRVVILVAADGSFSQYSLNYHRVLVDTLCQVELWRAELKERPFTDRYAARCRAAVVWRAPRTTHLLCLLPVAHGLHHCREEPTRRQSAVETAERLVSAECGSTTPFRRPFAEGGRP